MALTYTVFRDVKNTAANDGGDITSTSRTYNSGELLIAAVSVADNVGAGTLTIANSGTAQTWTNLATTNTNDNCKVAVWRCVMSTTQAMTVTVSGSATSPSVTSTLDIIQHAGQHATTPVPAGNVFSGVGGTDISQSITPTTAGSCLWMLAADWDVTNSFAARISCTLDNTTQQPTQQTTTLIRPTTQPRTDTSAFAIGETDTSGKIAWVAWEVQAAAEVGGSRPVKMSGTWLGYAGPGGGFVG